MRKITLLCILFACIFIVSGCAANDLPIKRKTNSKDDVIKFYGFDWLTERSVIEKKFNEDFGSDYICKEKISSINDDIDTIRVSYKGKNENDLDWSIAGHNISDMKLSYIKNKKNDKSYLYLAMWHFCNMNMDDVKDIINKLDLLYAKTESNDKEITYTDNNQNTVRLTDYSNKKLEIIYTNNDILKQVIEIQKDNNKTQQENTNGL